MVFSSVSPTVHTVTERKLTVHSLPYFTRNVDYTMYSTLQYCNMHLHDKYMGPPFWLLTIKLNLKLEFSVCVGEAVDNLAVVRYKGRYELR